MTCVSITLLTVWLMLRTVSMTMLYYLKLLTLSNHDLINFGNIKIWFMISKQNFTNQKSSFT